jgi:hypothetical protein
MMEEDKDKMAFISKWALMHVTLLFGLCNALATFQKVVTKNV